MSSADFFAVLGFLTTLPLFLSVSVICRGLLGLWRYHRYLRYVIWSGGDPEMSRADVLSGDCVLCVYRIRPRFFLTSDEVLLIGNRTREWTRCLPIWCREPMSGQQRP